jgi:endonuclease-8
MPEGPSLVMLREALAPFEGRRVLRVAGNSRLPIQTLKGRTLREVRTFGKQLLLEFGSCRMRVHFLLYGSWLIDATKATTPRLSLGFAKGREVNFYACSVRFLDGPLDELFDFSADVMSDTWDPAAARRKLRAAPDRLVADVLLDQDVFAGVGNIIKNEVLHRIRLHPGSRVGALPARKLGELVREARDYSFDFYRWRKAFELKKHYQVHTRATCPRDGHPVTLVKSFGKAQRRAFFCEACQRLLE